jgi:hypothetical protein
MGEERVVASIPDLQKLNLIVVMLCRQEPAASGIELDELADASGNSLRRAIDLISRRKVKACRIEDGLGARHGGKPAPKVDLDMEALLKDACDEAATDITTPELRKI